MSGTFSALPLGSCSPTFFTGFAVSTSLLNTINQTILNATTAQTSSAQALLQQATTETGSLLAEINAAAGSTTDQVLGGLPTSDTGLTKGQWWINGGIVSQVQ